MSVSYNEHDHTFVVCAYKESPFLEDCIHSLQSQTIPSNILVATSTPNDYIHDICTINNVSIYTGNHKSGIARDWNFAMNTADTPLVTIAHQDDVYKSTYTETMLNYVCRASNPLIFFSNYTELRDEEEVEGNRLLRVKQLMLTPLKDGRRSDSILIRRSILSFGDPIACPSITYVTPNLPLPLFKEDYKGSLDWQMLEELSKLQGDFLYCSRPLMSHRIHQGSETSSLIRENTRTKEDFDMFCKFWPRPVAKLISRLYTTSEKSNG